MKICYLSVYEDGTGYAHAALGNILALEAAGVEVVCRPISMTPKNGREEARAVRHLEGSLDDVDVVIQHCLPHTFERKAGVKNIGVFDWETDNFRRSTWPEHCNMMDQIWVPCRQNRQAAMDSGVEASRIKVVPHALDIDRFVKCRQPLHPPGTEGRMVLYTVGENIRRKNFAGLLRAYFSAFSRNDDVVLVIKTSVPGASPQQALEQMQGMIRDIQSAMHIYPNPGHYPPVLVITSRLSEEALDQLHVRGDIFVSLSHGEAFCLPAAHALASGKPLLVSNWGAFPDLLDPDLDNGRPWITRVTDCGWLVRGQMAPCFCPDGGFPVLYTGQEQWFDPDLTFAAFAMQEAYRMWQKGDLALIGPHAVRRASLLSHASVGEIAREALEE